MCVWLRYEKYDKLVLGIENSEVVSADGDRLRKKHPYPEFMELAKEHGWKPEPPPKALDGTVTLSRLK